MPKPVELPPDFPIAADVVRRVGEFMDRVDFDVDHVPPSWDLELTLTKRGVVEIDLDAQRVLALLLTWYAPGTGTPGSPETPSTCPTPSSCAGSGSARSGWSASGGG